MQTVTRDLGLDTSSAPPILAVSGESPVRARAAAAALGVPLCLEKTSTELLLVVGETDAWLEADGTEVRVSFDSATMRHRRRGGQNELLGRAVGVKADRKPRVWDATGGMGRDAFLLADLGCEVTLNERVPVLAWLLNEAIVAASVSTHEKVRDAAGHMTVVAGDSCRSAAPSDAVLYLDPMFPERRKAAAVKKEAVMLQRLTGGYDDAEQLWAWAWTQPVERIVVKRPLRAPVLGAQRPSHTLSGKSVRFDVFVRNKQVDSIGQAEV